MAVAGDDSHFHNGDLDAFGGYVMVKSESLEPESLLGALKAGEFYSTQGPRIHNIEITRKEVRVECSPVHTVALVTSASPAVSRVGRGLTQDDRLRRSGEMGLARPSGCQMVPHRRH